MITDHTSIFIEEAIPGVMIFIFDRPMVANFREELLRAQIGGIETAYVVRAFRGKVQLCLDNGRCVAHRRTGGHGAGRQRERLENGLLFDVFRVAHGHCPRFGGEKGGGAEEILSVLMHVGLIVFNLNNIVSTEFFDDDVGSFFLIMHGVEGEGGAVQNGHLSQESLGGGDLVGFIRR